MSDTAIVLRVAERLGSWLRPGLSARYVAVAVLRVLREPTEELIEAAKAARATCPEGAPPGVVFARAWRAMIDEAINGKYEVNSGSGDA